MEKITDGGVDVADHHKPQRQFGFTGKQIHRNKIQDKNKDTVSDRLQQRSGYRLFGMMGLMGKYLHGNVCLWNDSIQNIKFPYQQHIIRMNSIL